MSALKKISIFNAVDFLVRFEKGPDSGKVFRIFPPCIEVGRDPSLQIVITDPKASRKQFSISIKDNIILKDESSRKTTLVNGKAFTDHHLKPDDIISFGETEIRFLAKAKQKPKAAPAQLDAPAMEKQSSRKKFQFFVLAIVILGAGLFLLEESVAPRVENITTTDQLAQQIEESKDRQSGIKESRSKKNKFGKKRYIMSVDSHFIKGFRDLQAGQYSRAMDSFGTVISTDQNHARALQYSKVAAKQRDDLIDTHMRDGIKYKGKMMYGRCAAEFEKAIILVSNKNTQKYQLAKTHLEECRMLKSGGS